MSQPHQDSCEGHSPSRVGRQEYELGAYGTTTHRPARPQPSAPGNVADTTDTEQPRGKRFLPSSVSLQVALSSARDHLANERVFLAYIRTSSALANFAVVILQLYRLKHDPPPPGKLSDFDLGIPLAIVTLIISMSIAVTGAARFFICQNAMVRRKILGSGSMVTTCTVVLTLVS